MTDRTIVMLGTSEATAGGVSAVIRSYRRAGLFKRFPLTHIPTHCDGTATDKFRRAMSALGRYLSLLIRGRIALVHVHGASNASFRRKFPFIALAFVCRVPVIYHVHGGGFLQFHQRSGWLGRACIRLVLNRSARVIAVSDFWLAPLRGIAPRARIVRIYNPLSDPGLLDLQHVTPANPSLLFLGRIDADKGINELLSAFATVRRSIPDLHLDIGGDGELTQAREAVRGLDIEAGVTFHGWIDGTKRQALLQAAAAFVLPSYLEGLPMALIEAMAAAVPSIASAVGGVPDLITDGVEGLLVQPRDPQALANAISRLFADDAARQRMGRCARERIRRDFSPETIAGQVGALYQELLPPPIRAHEAT